MAPGVYVSPVPQKLPSQARSTAPPAPHRDGDVLGGFRPACEMHSVNRVKEAAHEATQTEWRRKHKARLDKTESKCAARLKEEKLHNSRMWEDVVHREDAQSLRDCDLTKKTLLACEDARAVSDDLFQNKSCHIRNTAFMTMADSRSKRAALEEDHCKRHNECIAKGSNQLREFNLARNTGQDSSRKDGIVSTITQSPCRPRGLPHPTRGSYFKFGAPYTRHPATSVWHSLP